MDPAALAVLTLIVAVYAAIISSGQLAWNVYLGWRDRAALKPEMTIGTVALPAGMPAPTSGPFAPGKWIIRVAVTNRGRRPIAVEAVGFDLSNGGSLFLPLQGLPAELVEGKSFSWPVELKNVRDGFAPHRYDPPTKVWIRDSVGRKHYGPIAENALQAILGYGPWGKAADS